MPKHGPRHAHRDQPGFRPDLRSPVLSKDAPSSEWSPWRKKPLLDLYLRPLLRFFDELIGPNPQSILEAGCGNGFLALELARRGHRVTAIDLSGPAIEIAKRTSAQVGHKKISGRLRYHCADITLWQPQPLEFDVAICNLSLHHIRDLSRFLNVVRQALRPRGRIICHEFCYDRLDDRTATWLYHQRRLLFLAGLSQVDPARNLVERKSIETMRRNWFDKYEYHELHGYRRLRRFLRAFNQLDFAWSPYLFLPLANAITRAKEKDEYHLVGLLQAMEEHAIEKRYIQAVAFRYVGAIE
jgi:SAM-dependent methyltransferase